MTEDTLLPCPFCGGTAERIDIEDGENAGGSCVVCSQCQASGNVEFEFKENFISNWNRRTEQPKWQPIETAPSMAMELVGLNIEAGNAEVLRGISVPLGRG